MRPGYRQFCAIGRTLDLVGQRWTLLVVRELSLRGPLTAGAISRGLPDVPMGQLFQRLAQLEAQGLVTAGEDGAYRLTDAGRELEPVLGALARFGLGRLANEDRDGDDAVVPHVLMRQLELRYAAVGRGVTGRYELVVVDPERLWSVEPGAPAPDRFAITAGPDQLSARAGACLDHDAVLRLSVAACCELVAGRRPERIEAEGDADAAAALLEALAPADRLVAAA